MPYHALMITASKPTHLSDKLYWARLDRRVVVIPVPCSAAVFYTGELVSSICQPPKECSLAPGSQFNCINAHLPLLFLSGCSGRAGTPCSCRSPGALPAGNAGNACGGWLFSPAGCICCWASTGYLHELRNGIRNQNYLQFYSPLFLRIRQSGHFDGPCSGFWLYLLDDLAPLPFRLVLGRQHERQPCRSCHS